MEKWKNEKNMKVIRITGKVQRNWNEATFQTERKLK